ncbi:MAG: exopolysaccharide biosynthesis protein [Phycisphaerales bacterium]|nr:exopolysaccharide biosynthesis protein [Phycisphaerales bacterium]
MSDPLLPRATPVAESAPESSRTLRLSEELARLVHVFAERPVTLREVVEVLQGRGYTLLLILLALPFCTPIPLPGLSTPFGLVIALIGFRLALRQKPWLPARLSDTALPPRFFAKLLAAGQRIVRFLEWGLRPRWTILVDQGVLHHAYGAMVLVSGLLLLLPLPIPFSNFLPAIVVVLTAAALLERDGYCAVAALVAFALTLAFFGALAWGGTQGVGWGVDQLQGWFGGD